MYNYLRTILFVLMFLLTLVIDHSTRNCITSGLLFFAMVGTYWLSKGLEKSRQRIIGLVSVVVPVLYIAVFSEFYTIVPSTVIMLSGLYVLEQP